MNAMVHGSRRELAIHQISRCTAASVQAAGKQIMTTDKPKTFAADELIQLHWQKIDETSKTEMVAQGGNFKTAEEMHEWIREVAERRKSECPEGWQPMVCDSTSEYFVWAAPSA